MAPSVVASGTWTDLKGATFTAANATDLFTKANHGLVAGDRIQVQNSGGALPTGMSAATDYFVIASGLTTNDFKVSATFGGSTINITSDGTGTQSFSFVEHILYETTAIATYIMTTDLSAMAAGDVVEHKILRTILAGGSARGPGSYFDVFTDAQPAEDQIKSSVPVSVGITDTGALRFMTRQPAGTARAIPYEILKFA